MPGFPQGFPILLLGPLCHGPHELRAIRSVTVTSTLEQRVSIAHLHHQLISLWQSAHSGLGSPK